MTVKSIFEKQEIPVESVTLGEVETERKLTASELKTIDQELKKVGFELIESRVNKTIEDIKKAVMEYIGLGMDAENIKLSSFITKHIPYD